MSLLHEVVMVKSIIFDNSIFLIIVYFTLKVKPFIDFTISLILIIRPGLNCHLIKDTISIHTMLSVEMHLSGTHNYLLYNDVLTW